MLKNACCLTAKCFLGHSVHLDQTHFKILCDYGYTEYTDN